MRFLLILLPVLLGGCAALQGYSAVAVQHRRTINDLQARATMAATCDIALGAYFRELSPLERGYAGLVCGGQAPGAEAMPAPLVAAEP